MTVYEMWLMMGLCTGFVPDNDELTIRLCQSQFEYRQRYFEGDDGFGLFAGVGKRFGRLYISDYIQKVSGQHTVVVTSQTNVCIDHHPIDRQKRYRFRALMGWKVWDFWYFG